MTALILGIVAAIIEIGYIIYLLSPGLAKMDLIMNAPVLVTILFWGGIVLSITSDCLIGATSKKNIPAADKKRIQAASVLSLLFVGLLIAGFIISFTTRGYLI